MLSRKLINELAEEFSSHIHDAMMAAIVEARDTQTGQRHTSGLVGNLFRIQTPDSVNIGDCFMKGRLKEGDLWLCIGHSGDCFQDYMFVEEYSNVIIGKPEYRFGSYGIGRSLQVPLNDGEFEILKAGGRVNR